MKPVLVVIDLQQDFLTGEGRRPTEPRLVRRVSRLVRFARAAGIPVLHVRTLYRDDLRDATLHMRDRRLRLCIDGTPGAEFFPSVLPARGEKVITKKRYSAFYGTDLEKHLERLDADLVILAGVNTHACVRQTAVDAYQRDLRVVIPREAVGGPDAAQHRTSLRYLTQASIGRVIPLHSVFAMLRHHVAAECETMLQTARKLLMRRRPSEAAHWYGRIVERFPGTRFAKIAAQRRDGCLESRTEVARGEEGAAAVDMAPADRKSGTRRFRREEAQKVEPPAEAPRTETRRMRASAGQATLALARRALVRGDRASAIAAYERVLSEHPESPAARTASQRLEALRVSSADHA